MQPKLCKWSNETPRSLEEKKEDVRARAREQE